MKLTRREFVLSTSGLLMAKSIFSQTKRRVIVLGAGLSGLSAAYELAQKGFEVTVVEARNRIGGRVVTLREPFADNQSVELGGELIGDGYKRFLGYATKFDIKFEEVSSANQTGGSVTNLQKGIGTSAILKGKLYPFGANLDANPYNLSADEARDLPPTILIKNIVAMASEVRADSSKLFEFDKISLAEALRKRGVSAEMIRLMNISLNYNDIETVSAGSILWESRRRISAGTKAVKIVGGNDLIPQALFENAVKAGVKFITEAKVKQISQTENLTKVSFERKGKTEMLEAEKLICTIPFSVLREVIFTPNLPEAKAKAIRELPYTRITKVFLQAKRIEWDRRNLGAAIWTDTPCERIFNAAGRRGDIRGIFTIWTDGIGANLPESLTDKARIAWGKKEFANALPFMKAEKAATKSWTNDKFVRGAYSHLTVGQLKDLQPVLKTAVGNIHFAGEHTAEFAPGMEGALESAERVVSEITK
jgi:monoamine oxidase